MKLRYYLRGLGIGMAVTAMILGILTISSGSRDAMSDEEVIARARELGMTERTVLSETVQNKEQEKDVEAEEQQEIKEQVNSEEQTMPEDTVEMDSVDLNQEEQAAQVNEESEEEVEQAEEEPSLEEPIPEELETIELVEEEVETKQGSATIHIVSGDSSDSVSRKLQEAGVIDIAADFDRYLCTNGYDKRICTGVYEIPFSATSEEIAKLITRRR